MCGVTILDWMLPILMCECDRKPGIFSVDIINTDMY